MTDVEARDAASLRTALAVLGMALVSMLALSPSAWAALGYEPAATGSAIELHGEVAHGVAIDQASQRIYVAELTASTATKAPGQVEQLESNGTPTSASPFKAGSQDAFSGVAVNPLTQGIYAAQFVITTPFGNFGTSAINLFSSAGTQGAQFAIGNTPGTAVQIATDSDGRVYFPSDVGNSVQVFNAAGTLQETITCSACPGGAFARPVSVAIDPAGHLYVADLELDRVLKFTRSSGPFAFDSVLHTGGNVGAVGVDPSDGTVFVGGVSDEQGYHVLAYDSNGQQFDDFGGDLFDSLPFGVISAGQIAVNTTAKKVYITDPAAEVLRVFAKVTINPPTAATSPATQVGQVSARLNAVVNPRFHGLTDCHFEYIDHAAFEVNGYANATDVPCDTLPGGATDVPVIAPLSTLTPNTTYHFRLVATSYGGTVNSDSRTFATLPAVAPTVTTEGAEAISQAAATLTGKVNPHGGKVTDCHFEYGPSFALSAPCDEFVGAVTTDVAQSARVTGLTATTTYHYRLVVTSNAGTEDGGEEEFTTLPPSPTVTTGAASGIGQSTATIAGTIDPNGAASSCQFEYGLTAAYGTVKPCAIDPGAGVDPVTEQLALAGLAAGTTYHYRLVGSNAGGTAKGLDLTFTTQSAPAPAPSTPVVPPPAQAAPPVATPPQPLKCKKGFRKAKVRGKLRCVKKKPKRRRR